MASQDTVHRILGHNGVPGYEVIMAGYDNGVPGYDVIMASQDTRS